MNHSDDVPVTSEIENIEELRFFVPGFPAPKGSKKHIGRGRMVEMSKNLPAWEAAVLVAATEALGGRSGFLPHEPLTVVVEFLMPRPRSVTRMRPTVAPDLDKLLRGTLDPLQNAGVYPNDAQVVDLAHVSKCYALEGQPAGAHITIRRKSQ